MNTRALIRTELNDLLLITADTYNDLIPMDISEEDFDSVANTIEEARKVAEDNLVGVTQEVIKETTLIVQEAQVKKEARVNRLLPKDIGLSDTPKLPDVQKPAFNEEEATKALEKAIPVKPLLEGPAPESIPRDVSAGTPELTPNQLVAATEQALEESSGAIPGISDAVEMDYSGDAGYDHELEMPIAQQNKIKAGIPVNQKPPVKTFGLYPKDAEGAPEAATAIDPGFAKELRQIGKLVSKYTDNPEPSTSMLANTVLSIVEEALDENFT